MDRIAFAHLQAERSKMLKRMADQVADAPLKRKASAELDRRLKDWTGAEGPSVSRRGVATTQLPATLTADPIELLIVRAISADRWRPSFGVMSNSAVYITHNGNWTDSSLMVFVTGLSPLLDQLAEAYVNLVDRTGGRFCERDGHFDVYPNAQGKSPMFATIMRPGLLRRVASAIANSRSSGREHLLVNFEDGAWPSAGVLSKMGYHVGGKGLPTRERRQILKQVYEVELVATSPEAADYISEWGAPRSLERRAKIVRCLRGFAAGARRKTSADMSTAIADWEADLKWFTKSFGP